MLRKWEKMPEYMHIPELEEYYRVLNTKRLSLLVKRLFDIAAALILLVILAIPMLVTPTRSARP